MDMIVHVCIYMYMPTYMYIYACLISVQHSLVREVGRSSKSTLGEFKGNFVDVWAK